jgi:predicted nucleotidyltransferase
MKKTIYAHIDTPWLKAIVSRKLGALLLHWVVQGWLYMDKTERWFKIGLDLVGGLMIGSLLRTRLSRPAAFGAGFFIAHTLNFLFNGHVWGVLKHFGGIQNSRDEFNQEIEGLQERLAREPSIVYAAAYGSLARNEWSPTSDLDVRMVRARGMRNGWQASVFVLRERTRAFLKGFPLDMFVFDDYKFRIRMREDAYPLVLKDQTVRS